MARKLIFIGNSTFDSLFKLQLTVIGDGSPDQLRCTPVIPIKSAKNEHFFNDDYKFSMCLPPKYRITQHMIHIKVMSHTS